MLQSTSQNRDKQVINNKNSVKVILLISITYGKKTIKKNTKIVVDIINNIGYYRNDHFTIKKEEYQIIS